MRNRNYSDNRSTKTRRKKNNKQRWATRLQNEGTIVCGCVYDGHRHLFISDRAPLYAYEANLQRHEKNSYIYFGSQDLYENEANINIRKILMMVHRITSNERPALRPERSGRRREKSAASRTFAYFFAAALHCTIPKSAVLLQQSLVASFSTESKNVHRLVATLTRLKTWFIN